MTTQAEALAAASRLHEYGTNFAHDASEANALYATLRAYLEESRKVEEIAKRVNAATYSHADGRDLLGEIHPRKTLDIKRRIDGRETWFEADWLSTLYAEIKLLRAALTRATEASDG